MLHSNRLGLRILYVVLLGIALTGCGRARSQDAAMVNGQVLLAGEKIPRGVISFIPQPGVKGPSGGSEISDGEFEVPFEHGLVQGDYRVEITVIPEELRDAASKEAETLATSPSSISGSQSQKSLIQRFNAPSLVTVLKPGENRYEIDLKPERN